MNETAPLEDVRALIARANLCADLVAIAGVKLRGGRGPCPLCGVGDAKDTAFSVQRGKARWKCFRCDQGGDAVALETALRGGSAADAARRILGEHVAEGAAGGARGAQPSTDAARERAAAARRRKAEIADELSAAYHARIIADLDAGAEPAAACAFVRGWLGLARGLGKIRPGGVSVGDELDELLGDSLQILRGYARAIHHEDFAAGVTHRRRAMVAAIEDAETGELVGRHVTYLKPDGLAKSDLEPARKIWGRARGGVWLTSRDNALGPLIVGEGIETVLSVLASWRAADFPARRRLGRAVAVLSLTNLQGGVKLDRWDRFDVTRAAPDPARPAVTWANAGDVVIAVDHDMRGVPAKLRKPADDAGRCGTERRDLTATERMELCAQLAAASWRAAGARDVRVARPPLGMDFNDLLRHGAAK